MAEFGDDVPRLSRRPLARHLDEAGRVSVLVGEARLQMASGQLHEVNLVNLLNLVNLVNLVAKFTKFTA